MSANTLDFGTVSTFNSRIRIGGAAEDAPELALGGNQRDTKMDSGNHARRAFVIMPFSKTKTCTEAQWTEIFLHVFKPAVESCGYSCERALPTTGSLIKSVIQDIAYSRIVIADITDRNANVFYELGVRHAVSKRTIMVTQALEHVPSDLRGHWSLVYSVTPSGVAEFKKEIARLIAEFDRDPEKNDSPVSEFLDREKTGIRQFVDRDNIKKISGLFTELTAIINTLNEAIENNSYSRMIEHGCIDLLLSTLYVDVGVDTLNALNNLRLDLKAIKYGMRLDREFITQAIATANLVLEAVLMVRESMMSGRFVEPQQISSMVWMPVDRKSLGEGAKEGIIQRHSVPDDLSKIDLSQLAAKFKWQQ